MIRAEMTVQAAYQADGSSLSFPDYGVYDMHVRITCKNGTRDHVRISIPINRKVADI